MSANLGIPAKFGLDNVGLQNLGNIYWNLYPPDLVEHILRRDEGDLAHDGPVVVSTCPCTGRSPNDKYIVQYNDETDRQVHWGKINRPISPQNFDRLLLKVKAFLQGRDVFVQDMLAGAHPAYQVPIRVITEKAWHSLFAHDLFIRQRREKLENHVPEFTVIQVPGFLANPAEDGTNSGVFIILNLSKKIILIGGTAYAGEIKKSIFSIMNYLMPARGVLSMHCSANVGLDGDTSLFFGLSGTGKTTLSSDPERGLIGDDEHGWGDEGVFNFEGGCYAKTIRLNPKYEPMIWSACHRFGTVIENVIMDSKNRMIDFDDASITENTRAAYPIDFVPGHIEEGYAGHPDNIFFLTADAFGVLPPLARLTPDQAMYYFLSGYTSKLAGTEKGLGTEPQATFSTCFGAPFLPLHPRVYARLLGERIARHNTKVWLINTGWTGGPYGIGSRIHLPFTRAMVRAALTHKLDAVPSRIDPYFGLSIPTSCPDVPAEVLDPRTTWADQKAYDEQARALVGRFVKNFEQFGGEVSPEIIAAGPAILA